MYTEWKTNSEKYISNHRAPSKHTDRLQENRLRIVLVALKLQKIEQSVQVLFVTVQMSLLSTD